MPAAQTFPAEPAVLIWARERAGFDRSEAAERLGLPILELESMEGGLSEPKISQLEKMATTYKTAFLNLILTKPPPLPPRPRDFRTFEGASPSLDQQLLLAFAETHEDRETASELAEELEMEVRVRLPKVKFGEDVEGVAAMARGDLGIGSGERLGGASVWEHFKSWRARVERRGVLVFRRPWSKEACRAFSSGDDEFMPAITICSEDWQAGQLFSLLHEYGHLLVRQPGMCSEPTQRSPAVEKWCNEFAAAMLMPMPVLEEALVKGGARAGSVAEAEHVRSAAQRLRVSISSAALRCEKFGFAPPGTYKALRPASGEHAAPEEIDGPPSMARSTPDGRVHNRVGSRFAALVMEAVDREVIDIVDADGLLGLAGPHQPKLRERLAKANALPIDDV